MGVDLGKIVSRKEIKFEDLKGKIVGVDAFNALYQFLSSIRGADGSLLQDSKGNITSHLQGLFSRTLNLMGKGIKLVYVFDGESPELKFEEKEARQARKAEAKSKYEEAVDDEDISLMNKFSKQFVRLEGGMIEESKRLLKAMGIPVVQAKSEAEGQIAYMCRNKDLDYAASQDYDSLLFGAPKLIRNLTLSQKRKISGGKTIFTFLEYIELNKVLEELGINQEQLIVLGILCGTDFNVGGVKGIGPKKGLKLLKENKDYDKMFSELNVDFDWKEVYNIFAKLPVNKNYNLKWEEIDEKELKKVLVLDHDFNEERIQSSLDKYYSETKSKLQKGLGDYF